MTARIDTTFSVFADGSDLYAIARVWLNQIDGTESFSIRTVRGELSDTDVAVIREGCHYVFGTPAAVGCHLDRGFSVDVR